MTATSRDTNRAQTCSVRARILRSWLRLAETSWLIEDRLGPHAEASFLRLVTSDRFDIVDLVAVDYERCLTLIETYDDLGLGFVDASIIAVAERLDQSTLATLNHRDFAVVRPAHRDAFELVP